MFYTSLSGLQAAQTDMATISHNLANVDTNGFKKSRTDFADVIASSVAVAPDKMVGSGVTVKDDRQQFGQGNLIQSASSLDLAVSGDGFFAVKPSLDAAAVDFTRNGAFQVDANRYVVDAQGAHLQVYPVDAGGAVSGTGLAQAVSLRLPATSGTPQATKTVALSVNLSSGAAVPTAAFDRANPDSYDQSTQTTVFDAAGNAQTMTTYFRRTAAGTAASPQSTWDAYSFVGATPLTSGGSDHQTLTFDASGKLSAPTTPIAYDAFTPASSGVAQSLALDFGSQTAQTTGVFNVAARTQDGKAVGQMQGVAVGSDGMVTASFSNGDTQKLGVVALANFTDPAGLRQLGDSNWAATGYSGSPTMGQAGANGFGNLMSGTIERSNVDITEELVNLIAAQRNFQANAKALDTDNQMSQTIFNLHN